MTITTILLDLDGVIRHFDPDHLGAVEADAGLEPGSLMAAAFEPELILSVTTGQITRAQWTAEIGRRVNNQAAASAWLGASGAIDFELMSIVDEVRSMGLTVAILTNGTDTVPAELAAHGIIDRFDALFNTADIGFVKPDRRAFEHVLAALDVRPEAVFFTDDSAGKLAGAIELGMTARQFIGVETFRAHLSELDIFDH